MKAESIEPSVTGACRRLREAGGKAYLVGGCVRDMILDLTPKDFDIEVYGLEPAVIQKVLTSLGQCEQVGKSFGVIKLWSQGIEIDVALPRMEKKTGAGHRGFNVRFDPEIDPQTASNRRDFTINAMMFDALSGELLDFHGGQQDLGAHVLRHVSPAFAEDPLRVLRAMQLAARFDLELADDTAALCQTLLKEADSLSVDRIWAEWRKWAMAAHPARGLAALEKSGWLALYPELAALKGCPQDARWHPEGDVWTHTCLTVDQAARVAGRHDWQDERRLRLVFAALCHDIGKPGTTIHDADGGIRSPGHCQQGTGLSVRLMQRIGAPESLQRDTMPLVMEHMTHMHGEPTKRAIRRLSHRLQPANIELWEALVEADASSRPPYPASRPALPWLQSAQDMGHHRARPAPIAGGKMLLQLGMKPGPDMGKVIAAAYEAQLDGAFDNEAAAMAWCRQHMDGL